MTSHTFVVSSLAIAASIACSTGYAVESVTLLSNGTPGHRVWQISQPRVDRKSVDYPQITFAPGERVTVTGVGCVQTGGHGHTWKRYVDPAGDKSDILYHGEVFIPGSPATPALIPIDVRQPAVYDIPTSANLAGGQGSHLILGFTDDHYGDNGYSDRNRDDGNYSQCWGLSDAVLTVDIAALPPKQPVPALTNYTFTVESVYIRNLRSRESDTEVLGAGVAVDGTPSSVAKKKAGDWHRGGPHSAAFAIELQEIQPEDRVDITYAIANAGHGSENKINDAIANVVESSVGKVPGFGSIVSAAAEAWSKLFDVLDPDCDGVVFADSVPATGADLAAWTQDGIYRRTISYPGTDSAAGCGGNSFYEVTYSIARNSNPEAAFTVNARSMRTAVRADATIIRTHALVNH